MTSSADQAKTAQLKELVFELAWKTKDEIICNLNQHTKLLSGLIIKNDTMEKMRKVNGDLMAALMNLPVKVDGRSKSFESLDHSSDDGSNEILFELNSNVRSRIVDTLMTNHNVVQLESNSVASEFKSELINRNNNLICELVKLSSRTIAIPSDSSVANGTSRLKSSFLFLI